MVNTHPKAMELSEISHLPLCFTTAEEALCKKENLEGVIPLKLQKKIF